MRKKLVAVDVTKGAPRWHEDTDKDYFRQVTVFCKNSLELDNPLKLIKGNLISCRSKWYWFYTDQLIRNSIRSKYAS